MSSRMGEALPDVEEGAEREEAWKDLTLKGKEEALPPMTIEPSKRAATSFESTSKVGVDGFHPKVCLDLTDWCCEEILILLPKIKMAGQRPEIVSVTLFFIIPKNVTGGRPIDLRPTVTRW